MIATNGMIPDMGKKQPSAERPGKGSKGKPKPKPKGGRTKTGFFVELPPELVAAFEAYLETLRPEVKKTALTQQIIEDFLASRGFWPWVPPGESEDELEG